MDRLALDGLKAAIPLSSVVSKYTTLRPAGRELVGRCPLHADSTPSFYVNDAKGTFHCFGCKAAGDVIDLIMQAEKLEFGEAVERLAGGPNFSNRRRHEAPKVTEAPPGNRPAAWKIWEKSAPLAGTVAETYLGRRGIAIERLPDLQSLRFARLPYQGSLETHPTLVAAAHDWRGNFVGIQRTYLTPDGAKLNVDAPKMTLGSFGGGAIQLGSGSEVIIVSEGIEDGLSVLLCVPHAAVWVSAGGNRMKSIELPPTCRRVVIAADNDDAGLAAAQDAAAAFDQPGREVRIMRPRPGFKDFNMDLQSETNQ